MDRARELVSRPGADLDAGLIPDERRSTAQSGITMTSALGGILSSTLGGLLLDVAGIDALYWVGGTGAVRGATYDERAPSIYKGSER